MKKKNATKVFAVLSTTALMLAACGTKEETSTEKKPADKETVKEPVKQVLNLAASSEIPSLNTIKATDAESFTVLGNVMEGLYMLDDKEEAIPGAAESVEVSEDKKVYTFKLRDAKWSNGDAVTAKDFEYAWKSVLDPKNAGEYAYIMYDIKNAAKVNAGELPVDQLGVKAIDEKTLEVTLENAVPYFLKLVSFPTFYPLNEKFVTSKGDKYALEAENMIYNGPFVVSEWKHEESYKLSKNPGYWDVSAVKLEEVNFKIVKELQTAVNLYETKEIDRVGLSAEFIDKYKADSNLKTKETPVVFFLRLNQKNEALKNVNIRKAIDLGYDKSGITNVILNNGSVPANYLVPKNFVKGPDGKDFRDANGDFASYNAEEAKKYWEQGLKELGKKEVKLGFLNYDSDVAKKTGEFIKAELEKNLPGLTVELVQQPFKQKLELENKLEYDISYAGWGPDYPDPMTFMDMFITDGSHNQMAYSNPEYDKLIKDAKTTLIPDLQKRWDALVQAEKVLLEQDQAISPMFQRGGTFLQREYVKNVVEHTFGPDFSFKTAYIEK